MRPTTFLVLNRAALIVRPKKPYIDWANSLEPSGPKLTPDRPEPEHTICLVEELSHDLNPRPALRKYCTAIFEQELAGWHRDPNDWPPKRDLDTFKEWFAVELHSLVVDLANIPLELEELAA